MDRFRKKKKKLIKKKKKKGKKKSSGSWIDQSQADQIAQWRQMMTRMTVMMRTGCVIGADASRWKQTDQTFFFSPKFCNFSFFCWSSKIKKGQQKKSGKKKEKKNTHMRKMATENSPNKIINYSKRKKERKENPFGIGKSKKEFGQKKKKEKFNFTLHSCQPPSLY